MLVFHKIATIAFRLIEYLTIEERKHGSLHSISQHLFMSEMTHYSLGSALLLNGGPWSTVEHYIGNRVPFGTQTLSTV